MRRQKEGLCIICGQPRVSPHYCLNHLVMARERQRNRIRSRRRNTGSKSYQLEAEARKTLARQRVRNKGRLAGKK
ncbi:MAG: hypothetical protein KGJ88_03675 [Verrucomicrobiota bacterium]|nr:hypothetical protein [Verrucomicrobiota bacterium]